MKITKVNAMKISALMLYLSTFFMTYYKMSILGETYRFYIQSAGAGGFFSFVMFFVVFYNMYLLVLNRYYAKDVFVGVIMFAIFMWVGLLASFPAGSAGGASLFFQFVFVFFMIMVAVREDIAVQIYDALDTVYIDMFPNAKRNRKKFMQEQAQLYEEKHDELHDMDFEKLKEERTKDYYNDRVFDPDGGVFRKQEKDRSDARDAERKEREKPVYRPVVEPVIAERVIEAAVEPTIEEPVIGMEEQKIKIEEPKGFTLEAPKIVNPYLTNPNTKK